VKVGIIGGSGKMGQWFTRFLLKEDFDITISGRDPVRLDLAQQELGVNKATNIELTRTSDVVLLSVNIDSFEAVIKEIAPFVRPDQVILDITSIKELPVAIMHQYLPASGILGTHPVFGPGAKDLANQNFVLTPTNERENALAEKTRRYLGKREARVSLMTPAEHDEMMAVVLGLAHFISIVAADTLSQIDKLPQMKTIGGSTYRVLTTLVESVISEDPNLYAALQMHLPHLVEIENLFQMNTSKWADFVRNRDKQAFIDSMGALKQKFAQGNTDFGQAYENMYKIIEWL
jgi:prephenate dehydrogenase